MNFSLMSVNGSLSDSIPKGFIRGFASLKSKTDEMVTSIEKHITSSDPKRQLRLGYSIVMKNNKILKSVADIQKGDVVSVGVYNGSFDSEVTRINSN